jgi:hypothetical protein
VLVFLLAACGDQTITVGGEVLVRHTIDLSLFEEYYRSYCETLNSQKHLVDVCIADKMADLVATLSGANLL